MLICKMEVWWHDETRNGKAVRSLISFLRDRKFGDNWEAVPPIAGMRASIGTWRFGHAGGGKGGHQMRVVEMLDGRGNFVAQIPVFEEWSAHTLEMGYGYIFVPDTRCRAVVLCPKEKKFRIRTTTQVGMSYGLVQGEAMYLEIEDVAAVQSAYYLYQGAGFTVSVPGPKGGGALKQGVAKVMSKAGSVAASTYGPWNDFTAPGWLTAFHFEGSASSASPYSIGLGTSWSWSVFHFGHEYPVELNSFSGGSTYALPGMGFTNGSMSLLPEESAK